MIKLETRIKRERERLMEKFKDLDQNKLATAQSLIDRAAFITCSLEDLEAQLNAQGWIEEYQNGENQRGYKKASAADLHISLTRNLNSIMKMLLEMVPPAKTGSKLEELMKQ